MSIYSEIADCDSSGCRNSISLGDSIHCQSCYDELLSKIAELEQKIEAMEYEAKEGRD